jgi:hypothetical protein
MSVHKALSILSDYELGHEISSRLILFRHLNPRLSLPASLALVAGGKASEFKVGNWHFIIRPLHQADASPCILGQNAPIPLKPSLSYHFNFLPTLLRLPKMLRKRQYFNDELLGASLRYLVNVAWSIGGNELACKISVQMADLLQEAEENHASQISLVNHESNNSSWILEGTIHGGSVTYTPTGQGAIAMSKESARKVISLLSHAKPKQISSHYRRLRKKWIAQSFAVSI